MSLLLTVLRSVLVICLYDLLQRINSWVADYSQSYQELCDYQGMRPVLASLEGDCIYSHHKAVYSLTWKERESRTQKASLWSFKKDGFTINKTLTSYINDCLNKNRMVLLHCSDSRSSIRLLSYFRCHGDPDKSVAKPALFIASTCLLLSI